jgi:hypothetical protein
MNKYSLALAFVAFVAAGPALAQTASVANYEQVAAVTGHGIQYGAPDHSGPRALTARQRHLNAVLDPYDGYAAPQS